MPIRWSAKAVVTKLDEIEQLLAEARPTLDDCVAKAKEISQIPRVPQYIQDPTGRLEYKIADIQRAVTDTIRRIRENVPEGAAEIEAERGDQLSMVA
ncbi:hypothetical protein ES703_89201 [subsurface metagenome]